MVGRIDGLTIMVTVALFYVGREGCSRRVAVVNVLLCRWGKNGACTEVKVNQL